MFFARLVKSGAAVMVLLTVGGCVSTDVKMIAPAEPAIAPEQVALYGSFPPRYREIALVEAHIYGPMFLSDAAKTGKAVSALAAAAASVGADGLMIRNLHPASMSPFGYGHRAFRMGTTDNSFAHMTVMHGIAIQTK
jgi:hypothetical protein